ncbi:MAG: hypothetical protein IKQ46_05190 [Bacteroidales bacterium]|nr:hypothetical protein [Bacteroidales bacterium]
MYSIGVYLFKPQDNNYKKEINKLVDKDWGEDLNKSNILSYIDDVKYPFLVSVNYKSKYISPLNITSEITDESVLARKLDIKNKYENKELNQKLYSYEQTLNQFLEEFVKLSKCEKNYTDNKNRTNQEGRNQMLLDLIDSYRTFYILYCQRNSEYEDDEIFKDIFKGHYNDVLKLADKNMARNTELKNIMELVKCSERYEEDFTKTFAISDIERDLNVLYSVTMPEESEMEHRIADLINKIETLYFTRDFEPLMMRLSSDDNKKILTELKNKYAITHCRSCRPKLQNAIAQYDSQIAEEQKADAIVKMNNLKTSSRTVLILSQNLTQDIGDLTQYSNNVFTKNVETLKEKQQNLQDLVNKDYSNSDAAKIAEEIKIIENTKFDVESLTSQLKIQFEEIKKNTPSNYSPSQNNNTQPKNNQTNIKNHYSTSGGSNNYEQACQKYNEAVADWQNYSQQISRKIDRINDFAKKENISFSSDEQQTYKSILEEISRLNEISKENLNSLTPYQIELKTDQLKSSAEELSRKTDEFYNDFMEGY